MKKSIVFLLLFYMGSASCITPDELKEKKGWQGATPVCSEWVNAHFATLTQD